ncbi:hypothetical protein Syun_009375 [Stephania yunnanensis]|uniref:KxDL domain-containing protein n=1 Tax=Stephania yunnanensis TaxID=152371 RepID=A0AAP0KEC6_9MAGN
MEMEQQERDSIMTPSNEVSHQFETLINANDLHTINQSQHLILGRLQDSNAVLSHFNEYSERCFAEVSADFHKNTRLLKSMKSDLDYIFQKLRRWGSVGFGMLNDAMIFYIFSDTHVEKSRFLARNMKANILATYPDAFPDDTESKVLDQRPDLERPQ